MRKVLLSLILSCSLQAEKIDIVANFILDELVPQSMLVKSCGDDIRSLYLNPEQYVDSYYSHDVEKVFFMNDIVPNGVWGLPKEKLVLFVWEPGGISPSYADNFSRVYTYNDNLIDGIKYFKFFYPVLTPMISNHVAFDKKRLCVMIASNPTSQRIRMIDFFETKPLNDFAFYGFNPLKISDRYRGKIRGHPLSREKLRVLNRYRFCICFENNSIAGYITEKIFACFAAGCVPIYYGAPNVENYIPKECFIDFRDFEDNEELYQFIKTMPEEQYQQYIENIRRYLQSERAYVFSPEHFCETIQEAVRGE